MNDFDHVTGSYGINRQNYRTHEPFARASEGSLEGAPVVSYTLQGPPGVLGIWGEWLFIFRELGSTGNYFRGPREQAHILGDLGSPAKKPKKGKASILLDFQKISSASGGHALMSGAVLGGVAEVVGSNLARGKIFTASIGSFDSLYPSVFIYCLNLHQFLILCSSKAMMFVKLYVRTSDIYLISLVSLDPSGFHLRTK